MRQKLYRLSAFCYLACVHLRHSKTACYFTSRSSRRVGFRPQRSVHCEICSSITKNEGRTRQMRLFANLPNGKRKTLKFIAYCSLLAILLVTNATAKRIKVNGGLAPLAWNYCCCNAKGRQRRRGGFDNHHKGQQLERASFRSSKLASFSQRDPMPSPCDATAASDRINDLPIQVGRRQWPRPANKKLFTAAQAAPSCSILSSLPASGVDTLNGRKEARRKGGRPTDRSRTWPW